MASIHRSPRQASLSQRPRYATIVAAFLAGSIAFLSITLQAQQICSVVAQNSEHSSALNVLGVDDDYMLAYNESLGFFDDITSKDWRLMREIALKRVNNINPWEPLQYADHARYWYQNNYEPDFSCRHDTKVGIGAFRGFGDGSKWVCDPLRLKALSRRRMEAQAASRQKSSDSNSKMKSVEAGCLVYSIGSNGNFDFEEGLFNHLGPGFCEVHTFDFTDYSSKVPPNIRNIHFHAWGLTSSYNRRAATQGATLKLMLRQNSTGGEEMFKTLQDTMRELGHEGRTIDIFKIDCEGCEWTTYEDWLSVDIRQILVEVHDVPEVANDFFLSLQRAGYVTFHKEPNIQYGGGNCVEYAMLKLSKDFVENELAARKPVDFSDAERRSTIPIRDDAAKIVLSSNSKLLLRQARMRSGRGLGRGRGRRRM